jgi:hypothetical protein
MNHAPILDPARRIINSIPPETVRSLCHKNDIERVNRRPSSVLNGTKATISIKWKGISISNPTPSIPGLLQMYVANLNLGDPKHKLRSGMYGVSEFFL